MLPSHESLEEYLRAVSHEIGQDEIQVRELVFGFLNRLAEVARDPVLDPSELLDLILDEEDDGWGSLFFLNALGSRHRSRDRVKRTRRQLRPRRRREADWG